MTHARPGDPSAGSADHGRADAASDSPDLQWNEAWTEDEGQARVRALFADMFGAAPTAVASSPGHVTLVGDHTDYSDGLSLSTITAHRTYAAVRARDDSRLRVFSAQCAEVDGPHEVWKGDLATLAAAKGMGWVSYVTGVLWSLTQRGYPVTGVDIAVDSCVPVAAGLGSSASMQGAVALALNECWGLALDTRAGRAELAQSAVDAEVNYVGIPVGGLGQHTILRCEPGEGLLLDFDETPVKITRLALQLPNYGLCQLVVDTHTPHAPGDGQLAQRRLTCGRAAQALGAANLREVANKPDWFQRVNHLKDPALRAHARHVVTEIHRVRLVYGELSGTSPAQQRFVDIGKALYRSHASLAVDFGVSTDALDLVVKTAFDAGALGTRLVGSGRGGCAVAVLRKDQAEATARLIDQAFVAHGFARPTFLTA